MTFTLYYDKMYLENNQYLHSTKLQGKKLLKMKYDFDKIGKRLQKERKEQKMSQDDLMERLKKEGVYIGRNKLSAIENGKADISGFDLNFLFKLCIIFNCDIGYLLCEYDTKHHVTADICENTGLSENAVEKIIKKRSSADEARAEKIAEYEKLGKEWDAFDENDYQSNKEIEMQPDFESWGDYLDKTALNALIESNEFYKLLNILNRCMYCDKNKKISEDSEIFEKELLFFETQRLTTHIAEELMGKAKK